MTDYKAITFENIDLLSQTEQKHSDFDNLIEEYLCLKNFNDTVISIPTLSFSFTFDTDTLNSILKTAYTKSSFTDEFIAKLSTQRNFIQTGLTISDGAICPFCGQNYSQAATDLIDKYNKYLNDSENKVKTQLSNIALQLEKISDDVTDLHNIKYPNIKNQVNLACANLSKSKRISLQELPGTFLLVKCINSIQAIIDAKNEAVDCDNFEMSDLFSAFNDQLTELKTVIQQINYQIGTVNTNVNNMSKEKLRIKKEICKAFQTELSIKLKNDFALLRRLRNEYKDFLSEVQQKEATAKVSKKALVSETFSQLTDYFFNGKYSFDAATFSLEFKDAILNDTAAHILSDGEKIIIAMLFFIANIHSSVNNVNDYENMLIVIDDPSSNLDFENSIKFANILSDINSIINVNQDIKTIILTHNMIFRDEIIKQQNVTLLEI